MRIINPYQGVNFASTPRLPANSHEHIYNDSMLQGSYRRGIRVFACVNYFPSAPSVAPSGKLGLTSAQNFSSWKIPVEDWIDPSDIPSEVKDKAFNMSLSELQQYKTTRYYERSYPTIEDEDGNIIQTADIPQIANMEFAFLPWKRGVLNDRQNQHCNILGNLFAIPTNGMRDGAIYEGMTWDEEKAWRTSHPLYSMEELAEKVLSSDYQQFDGKIFGTANHNYDYNGVKRYFDTYPEIFKAMECFNQYYSRLRNEAFRSTYDRLLREGYRIWGTAVADWSGSREKASGLMPREETEWQNAYSNLTDEEKAQYGSWQSYYEATAVKECGDKARGCNVLFIPDYDNLIAQGAQVAAEAALDAYIAGRYFMSGWGKYYPTNIEVSENEVTLTLSDNAETLVGITNTGKVTTNGNVMTIPITPSTTYIRFEAYYSDKDFVFTNPIFIEQEQKKDDVFQKALLLGII